MNNEEFESIQGKSKHELWFELCDLIAKNPDKVIPAVVAAAVLITGAGERHASRSNHSTRPQALHFGGATAATLGRCSEQVYLFLALTIIPLFPNCSHLSRSHDHCLAASCSLSLSPSHCLYHSVGLTVSWLAAPGWTLVVCPG